MTQPIDPRELAALLEGRVEGRERDDLLARIAASDEEYDVAADAATLLNEMEEEDAAAATVARAPAAAAAAEAVTPPRPAPDPPREAPDPPAADPAGDPETVGTPISTHPRWRWRGWTGLAVAAVAAAVALVPARGAWVASRQWRDPTALAAQVSPGAGRMGAGWDTHAWDSFRGGGGAPVAGNARSAQAGAELVDLAVAVRTRDSLATVNAAASVESLLNDVPAVTTQYARIRARAGRPAAELEPLLRRAQDDARRVTSPDAFALGAWTEAARIAALRGDAGFFRSAASRRAMSHAAGSPLLDANARTAVATVRAKTETGEVGDWKAVRGALGTVQRALAGQPAGERPAG